MCVILTSKNEEITVDEDDVSMLIVYNWDVKRRKGRVTSVCRWDRNLKTLVLISHLVVNCPDGMVVDHINGNPLDNRKKNLRVCTQSENSRNRNRSSGISKYKGVSWDRNQGKWQANITIKGEQIRLGRFQSETEAAMAYDWAAIHLHGDFSKTNGELFEFYFEEEQK